MLYNGIQLSTPWIGPSTFEDLKATVQFEYGLTIGRHIGTFTSPFSFLENLLILLRYKSRTIKVSIFITKIKFIFKEYKYIDISNVGFLELYYRKWEDSGQIYQEL